MSLKSVTPEKIVGVTPRISVGAFDVTVRNPGQQEGYLFKGFKYE